MPEKRWADTLLRYAPFAVGALYAVYSSLSVLNPDATLWSNDEGHFLRQGQSGNMVLDPRYGVFSVLVFVYFKIFQVPFAVVIAHKIAMLATFVILFQRRIIDQAGILVFSFLFVVFLYLNAYLLRDSLIFIACLLAVSTFSTDRSVRGAIGLVPIALLRPQALLFFVRPWLAIAAIALFVGFLRPLYATAQLRDNGNWTILHQPFFEDVLRVAVTSLANLNPLPKLPFYLDAGLYLEYGLLVLASIPLFAILAQAVLAVGSAQLRFWHFGHVLVGLACMLLMYGAIGAPADVRVFFATVCPFFFLVHKALLKWRYLALLTVVLTLATVARIFLKAAGL